MIFWPLFWLLQKCLQDNPWKQREISHILPGRQSHSSPGCYLQWSAGWCTDTFDYHEINFGWSSNLGTHSAGLTCWCCCQAPGAARLCRWPLRCSALLLRWGKDHRTLEGESVIRWFCKMLSSVPSKRKQRLVRWCCTWQVTNKEGGSCKLTNFSLSFQLTWFFFSPHDVILSECSWGLRNHHITSGISALEVSHPEAHTMTCGAGWPAFVAPAVKLWAA